MSRSCWKTKFISRNAFRYLTLWKRERRLKLTAFFIYKYFAEPTVLNLNPRLMHIADRGSFIARWFTRRRIRVYNGYKWRNFFFSRWYRGWRFGGFTRTLTVATFRKKTLSKKVKPVSLKQRLREENRISDIKKVKAGQRRKHIVSFAYEKTLAAEFQSIE